MTTIVADSRSGIIVCDSRMTMDVNHWIPSTKVERMGDELIGCAGDDSDGQRWRSWYIGGKTGARPKCADFSALILRKTGVFYVYDGGYELLVERGFHAIGSGGGPALGALLAGATPKAAVRIACQIDNSSGGAIRVFKLLKA